MLQNKEDIPPHERVLRRDNDNRKPGASHERLEFFKKIGKPPHQQLEVFENYPIKKNGS